MFKIEIFIGVIDPKGKTVVDTFYSQVCPVVGSEFLLDSPKISGVYTAKRVIPLMFTQEEGIVLGSIQTVMVVI